jgi:hypothetical protein
MKTNRNSRIEPKKELNYLAWFYGAFILLILINEFFSKDRADYLNGQGKIIYFLFILFIYRLFTMSDWSEHYRETINFIFRKNKSLKNKFVLSSVLNVLLDAFILIVLFFWIEVEKVSFIRIPVVGLVYVLLIGFSALLRKWRHN